ncbi:hypothetical protein SteCoe_25272 [Stentor coeruleus]|uniref:Uncharacterized protein n=1 Tax=Stentor coeruleus TaxID=5963 RepID=A0A1R2BFS4_9CILI|nr:hypothetical protein SteCoe_25272 [Stentor coeruleus]
MGKRNLARYKKQKSVIKKIALVVSGIQDFLISKENYVHELNNIFCKFLSNFQIMTEACIESKACVQIKCIETYSICNEKSNRYVQDPCNEYFHIFCNQLQKFLNSVIAIIKEVYLNHPNLLEVIIKNSFKIIESVGNEVSKISSCYATALGLNFSKISLELYNEMLLCDSTLRKPIKFYSTTPEASCSSSSNGDLDLNNAISSPVKKNKRKRRMVRNKTNSANDIALDLEIEEFTNKLDHLVGAHNKIKPNLTEDWVAGIRKRLKERTL